MLLSWYFVWNFGFCFYFCDTFLSSIFFQPKILLKWNHISIFFLRFLLHNIFLNQNFWIQHCIELKIFEQPISCELLFYLTQMLFGANILIFLEAKALLGLLNEKEKIQVKTTKSWATKQLSTQILDFVFVEIFYLDVDCD